MAPEDHCDTGASVKNPPLQTPTGVAEWAATLAGQRQELLEHPLHQAITSPARLRLFCERHVYCVWDFMSLLKGLQRDLTCMDSCWTPPKYPRAARLINEIVLGEETDEIAPGRFSSHFDWYLEAMDEFQANTAPIRQVIQSVRSGVSPFVALESPQVPEEARRFTSQTLQLSKQPLATRLAVFFFAREDIIPGLFLPLVKQLSDQGLTCRTLIAYLERHVDIDGGSHGPMARQLLEDLVHHCPETANAAYCAAARALVTRQALWDRIYVACNQVS